MSYHPDNEYGQELPTAPQLPLDLQLPQAPEIGFALQPLPAPQLPPNLPLPEAPQMSIDSQPSLSLEPQTESQPSEVKNTSGGYRTKRKIAMIIPMFRIVFKLLFFVILFFVTMNKEGTANKNLNSDSQGTNQSAEIVKDIPIYLWILGILFEIFCIFSAWSDSLWMMVTYTVAVTIGDLTTGFIVFDLLTGWTFFCIWFCASMRKQRNAFPEVLELENLEPENSEHGDSKHQENSEHLKTENT